MSPLGANPPAITTKTCVFGTKPTDTFTPMRILSRMVAPTTVLPFAPIGISVTSIPDCHPGPYPPINESGGSLTSHANPTRIRGYFEAHTPAPLVPGPHLETAVIPLCKVPPGHKLTAHVITVTIAPVPAARSYYPPITGVGVNANVPPGTTITATVTFIGAKTPLRPPITHKGCTIPIILTPRMSGPSAIPGTGGPIGASTVALFVDPSAYNLPPPTVYPYNATTGGAAPGTPVGTTHHRLKTPGRKSNEVRGKVVPRPRPPGPHPVPTLSHTSGPTGTICCPNIHDNFERDLHSVTVPPGVASAVTGTVRPPT